MFLFLNSSYKQKLISVLFILCTGKGKDFACANPDLGSSHRKEDSEICLLSLLTSDWLFLIITTHHHKVLGFFCLFGVFFIVCLCFGFLMMLFFLVVVVIIVFGCCCFLLRHHGLNLMPRGC